MIETSSDLEKDPLYDVALSEVVQAIGHVPTNSFIRIEAVRELMIAAWIRGFGARVEMEE